MFKKILIANRGEIACRVMATATKMGIKTVAVYSDADAHSKHVQMADEAVHIGASPVSESYLLGERIIAAALQTGAQGIHPGYGFLSENAEFVDAVTGAGLVFIGPSASAIRSMGLKDAAKSLMETAGVPVVPGYHGDNQDAEFLAKEADKIEYPVLIKARAGGGGKGMRLVEDPKDFAEGLASAAREGLASFGDAGVLIEKYIQKPRHIEIQVFGDSHGNIIHLFERDCSLQRRHQKVIEEAPAPDMPQKVRDAMGLAAINAAKAVNYEGAGTVEFIVDGEGGLREDGFWFMEMNTRLQVEHPVSEAITGLDFVEMQLRVASGEALPVKQTDLQINGHSFEARLYAEDVEKGFLPATGRLDHLKFPTDISFELTDVRIDSGVRTDDEVSPFYDPMIAKVIVHGKNRAEALSKLDSALCNCEVAGCVTNLPFLIALARDEEFAKGQVDTGLIARKIDTLTATANTPEWMLHLASAVFALPTQRVASNDPWDKLTGYRNWEKAVNYVNIFHKDNMHTIKLILKNSNEFSVSYQDYIMNISSYEIELRHAGNHKRIRYSKHENLISFYVNGQALSFEKIDPLDRTGVTGEATDFVVAPMPGNVLDLSVASGQLVRQGDKLLVLEAMKMEHILSASRDGVIEEVMVAQNDQVSDGDVLIRFEAEDE